MGNLLGSNLFNMAILAIDDLLYLQAPLLTTAEPAHMVTANAAMAMTAIAVIGLGLTRHRRRLPLRRLSCLLDAISQPACVTCL